MKMGIPERKEREKEARREEILDAAQKVFFEKGLAVSTVDDIAQAAELSKGTLYLYYHSKEDLYLAAANRGMDTLYEMFVQAVAATDDPIRQIFALGSAHYEFFQRKRDYFRMFYFFESPQIHSLVSEGMMTQCAERDRKVWAVVMAPIKRAIDAGLLHPELDPLEVGIMLWSNANGFFRLIDRNEKYWKETMGIDLFTTHRKSSELLLKAMMTEKAQRMYGTDMFLHAPAATKENQG
jgi:AcrR family transcriptional regulator